MRLAAFEVSIDCCADDTVLPTFYSTCRSPVRRAGFDLHQNTRMTIAPQPDFEAHRLTGAMIPTWYVSFEIRQRGVLPRQRSPRETRTFATEDEAKLFARAKLDEGLSVFAGTINPHVPRRLIPASDIHAWLGDDGRPLPPEASSTD